MIISIVMILSAGGLLVYNNDQDAKQEEESTFVVSKIEETFDEKMQNGELHQEESQEEADIKAININGYNYIGIIYIPKFSNLALPVIEECSENNLKISICRYSGSIDNDNMVIAGHNYKSSFGKLSKLEIDDILYFKDMNGIVYKYKLKEKNILAPTSVKEMKEGDWDLTLFTCTYDGRARSAYRFERDGVTVK